MANSNTVATESQDKVVHDYPLVHGILTHVIKYGRIPDSNTKAKALVLVIPGNPGAIDFYQEFMKTIHERSHWPVWGISHAGHASVPSHIDWIDPDSQVFTVEGQIQHKAFFINEFLPDDIRLILIGHSIGAHVVLEVMGRIDSNKVLQGMLLFPTIERMAESPRGLQLTPILKYARWLPITISFCLSLLPESWKHKLINRFLSRLPTRKFIPECINRGALQFFDPYCVTNTLYMAHKEMELVTDLNKDLVDKLLPKLLFYYGRTDHWCPLQYYEDMKARFPEHGKIYLCDGGFRHAFIVSASKPMGEKVAKWLEDWKVS